MAKVTLIEKRPDGKYLYSRWVRERPSAYNEGGWVEETWLEDEPLKQDQEDGLHKDRRSHIP